MANKDGRTRTWVAVIYPESLPDDWLDYLTDTHIECCISPLHDSDINPTGETKKPHYHIILNFGSLKSHEQVMTVLEHLNCPPCQPCSNIKGYVRYLVHKDNPEKHQYSELDIKALNGFDIAEHLKSSGNDRYLILGEIFDYIDNNGLTEFKDIMDYARKDNFEWFKVLCDSGHSVEKYINSCRHYGKLRSID